MNKGFENAGSLDSSSQDDLDIQEVDESEESEEETDTVIEGGPVEAWEPIRVRAFITHSIISLLVIWVFMGLVFFVATGVPWLLASSPTILTYPVYKVFGYYFRNEEGKPKIKKAKRKNT